MSKKLNTLPIEVQLEVYKHLSPQYAAKVETTLSHSFIKNTKEANLFWQAKHQQHFPDHYNHLLAQQLNLQEMNWYAVFSNDYHDQYKNLPVSVCTLFSLLKEEDTHSILKIKLSLDEITNKLDKNGCSLADLAKNMKNQAVLNHFYKIAKKALPLGKKDSQRRTLLYWAIVFHQDKEEIQRIIHKTKSPLEAYQYKMSDTEFLWYTPHVAANEGHLDALEVLLANIKIPSSTFLNYTDNAGHTPLMYAAFRGHLAMVEYLLNKSDTQLNVLSFGIYHPYHLRQSVCEEDFELYFSGSKTALHWALDQQHHEVAIALIESGIDVNILDDEKNHPIHLAAKNGSLNVIKAFINKYPLLLDLKDKQAKTPLLLAAAAGYDDIVTYLIKMGANLEITVNHLGYDDHQKTILDLADENGHDEVVLNLLKHMSQEDIDRAFIEKCNSLMTSIIDDMKKLLNDNQSRSNLIFFSTNYGKMLQKLLSDLQTTTASDELSYIRKIMRIASLLSKKYNTIKPKEMQEFISLGSADQLLMILKIFCQKANIQITQDYTSDIAHITGLNSSQRMRKEQQIHNKVLSAKK